MPSTGPDCNSGTISSGTVRHIAVGIITNGRKVFITRRPKGVHQGEKWEFPGGKLDPGETIQTGLARELREELGIEVESATPFIQIHHAYSDISVLLDVWWVTRYHGIPHGREGQPVSWVSFDELTVSKFPQADRLIVRKLQLPALYLITNSRQFGWRDFLALFERALGAGARLVQFREPHMSEAEYRANAKEAAALCHRYGAKLLLNADPEWVDHCGADGVHLNSRRLAMMQKRPLPPDMLVAASCHNAAELKQAEKIEADFVVLSPVASTSSHPDTKPLGWENFKLLCSNTSTPVYALGGMRAEDLSWAHRYGAQGLAMVSGVWEDPDFETVIATLR